MFLSVLSPPTPPTPPTLPTPPNPPTLQAFEVNRLYGGFYFSPQLLLSSFAAWEFLSFLSYINYVFIGVAINELAGVEYTCGGGGSDGGTGSSGSGSGSGSGGCEIHTGDQLIHLQGYDRYSVPLCAGAVLAYCAVMRLVAYVALRCMKR